MVEFVFRKADFSDIDKIWEIILQAKAQMKSLGSSQWDDSYPLKSTIEGDIMKDDAYVLEVENNIAAYCVIGFEGELAYNSIDGLWISDADDYVVVHRLAVSDMYKNRGYASRFMMFAEDLAIKKGCKSFRIDTNFDNKYMLAIIKKLGFCYCGKVFYSRGERLAYEKLI